MANSRLEGKEQRIKTEEKEENQPQPQNEGKRRSLGMAGSLEAAGNEADKAPTANSRFLVVGASPACLDRGLSSRSSLELELK